MKLIYLLKSSSLLITMSLIINSGNLSAQQITPGGKISGDVLLWDLFTKDYRVNCKKWKHNTSKNPVIPSGLELWRKFWTANPAVIEYKGEHLVYFRGNGITPENHDRHDRIAVARITKMTPDDFSYEILNDRNFIVDIGSKGTFDDSDVLDPGVVVFNDKVFLYYSGVGTGSNSVGLAKSKDGVHFEKYGKVIVGRSPSVVVFDNKVYMIYQNDTGSGFRDFFLAESADGINFKNVTEKAVLSGQKDSWDKYVTTARLYKENDAFLIIYGGSPDLNDQPDYFGLAKSNNLIKWEKHPGNPVFGLEAKGEEDGGAIWFPALIDIGSHYLILYEGSRGRYSWDLSSQICMASIAKEK